jgi:hypothetical protein
LANLSESSDGGVHTGAIHGVTDGTGVRERGPFATQYIFFEEESIGFNVIIPVAWPLTAAISTSSSAAVENSMWFNTRHHTYPGMYEGDLLISGRRQQARSSAGSPMALGDLQ